MPLYDWNKLKNDLLLLERDICFENVVEAIGSGNLLDVIEHPNKSKYPNQKLYIVKIYDYVYVVPFIEKESEIIFMKTIFPSRKLTKDYLGGRK